MRKFGTAEKISQVFVSLSITPDTMDLQPHEGTVPLKIKTDPNRKRCTVVNSIFLCTQIYDEAFESNQTGYAVCLF